MTPPSPGEQSLADLLTKLRGSYHLYSAAELQQVLETLGYPPEIIAHIVADWNTRRPRAHSLLYQFTTRPTLLIVILLNAELWLLRLAIDLSPSLQTFGILLAIVGMSGSLFFMTRWPPQAPVMRSMLAGVLATSMLWGGILVWGWWQSSGPTLIRIYDMLVSLANDYQ
jgi:hypothetical protein